MIVESVEALLPLDPSEFGVLRVHAVPFSVIFLSFFLSSVIYFYSDSESECYSWFDSSISSISTFI